MADIDDIKDEMDLQDQDDDGNISDSDSEESDSFDENDVDELLEQALPEDFRRTPKRRKLMPQEHDIIRNLVSSGSNSKPDDSNGQHGNEAGELGDEEIDKDDNANKFKEKVVTILEEKGKNKFDDLPGGWIQVRHVSGMPIFLHRKTRVCTLAKPYRLGPGSARRHSMPMSAIPCYAYRKAMERESVEINEVSAPVTGSAIPASDVDVLDIQNLPPIKLETLPEAENIMSPEPTETENHAVGQTESYFPLPTMEMPKSDFTSERQIFSTPNKSKIHSIFNTPSDNGIEFSSLPSSPSSSIAPISVTPHPTAVDPTPMDLDMDDELEPGEILDDDDEDDESCVANKNDLSSCVFAKHLGATNTTCDDNSIEYVKNVTVNGNPRDAEKNELNDTLPVLKFGEPQNDFIGSSQNSDKDSVSSNKSLMEHKSSRKCPKTPIQQRLRLFFDNKIPDNSTANVSNDAISNLIPKAQVETAQEAHELNSVSPEELREYCMKLFKFKQVKCKKFKSWSDRRKHAKEQKRLHLQRPTLPDGVQLITFPVQRPVGDSDSGKIMKEYTMNPQGKSSVCILHEYVQHALRMQPSYSFGEIRNSAAPYAATVMINNVQYGSGYGTSKKIAKAAAASATLEILIPKMKDLLKSNGNSNNELYHIGYFDQIDMDDPRIPKMCASVSEPSPYALLLACLQRNFGQGSTSDIKFEVVSTGSQANRFKMQTGEYSVEVTASNKREGKQLASQALLCKIHPHIKNFGSFLRLYGNGSIKSVKEKKQEEQQITTLQSKASANSPNYAILNKLKEEMMKLRAKMDEEKNQLTESSSENQELTKPNSLAVS